MTFTHSEKHDAIKGRIYSLHTWLSDFGGQKSKFPQHLIEQRRRELEVMQAIAGDYEKAAQRDERKQA